MTNVEKEVQEIIRSCHVDNKALLTDDLRRDLGMDSLDILDLLFQVEKHFGVVIDDYAYERVRTGEDIVMILQEHKNY